MQETTTKQDTSYKIQGPKRYDLEERTFTFAKRVREFIQKLPRTIANAEDVKQLVRASGSIGANYIEANDALGKKDFLMRIRISRKEAKESKYWLLLINVGNNETLEDERQILAVEASEFVKIFSAMIQKVNSKS